MRIAHECDNSVDNGGQRAGRTLDVCMVDSCKCVRLSFTQSNQNDHECPITNLTKADDFLIATLESLPA